MFVQNFTVSGGVATPSPVDERAWRAVPGTPDSYQWLVLARPGTDELTSLREHFGLHPLAVEDAGEEHQRPKLERYGDHVLLVVKTMRHVGTDERLRTGEVNVFVGADFAVTVLHGDAAAEGPDGGSAFVDALLADADPETLAMGPAALLHAVCDHVVDSYEEAGEALARDAEALDDAVFDRARDDQIPLVHMLRRHLADVRRCAEPLREPLARLAEESRHAFPHELVAYLRDVGDHLHRFMDTVDHLEGSVASAFDALAAQISLRQNEDMRKISAGAALVVVPTLIAGVYGMNFRHMPELDWQFGYAFALGLMAASVALMWVLFRRSGWF
ncbi:MAG: magnesium and cobalt transport protein CorA [Nocardioides sp.]|uniref:magnesium and cobalt transport protein CorA n=1 Tax=Nocardioides sp. TaxID=35761 RepID=UPI003F05193F